MQNRPSARFLPKNLNLEDEIEERDEPPIRSGFKKFALEIETSEEESEPDLGEGQSLGHELAGLEEGQSLGHELAGLEGMEESSSASEYDP